jgi:hypothetical protein
MTMMTMMLLKTNMKMMNQMEMKTRLEGMKRKQNTMRRRIRSLIDKCKHTN